MSIFYCIRCDHYRDSDDGCDEIAGDLICQDCADEIKADAEFAAEEYASMLRESPA